MRAGGVGLEQGPAGRAPVDPPVRCRLLVALLAFLSAGTVVGCSSSQGEPKGLLSWAPPDMADATTISVGDDWVYELNPGRDYRVVFPARPVDHPVVLSGGRNVVVIGGEINIADQGPDPSINQRRGLFLRKQTGVVHIEGLLITGEDLSEGIQIDAPDAVVQLQNVRVEHIRARDQVEFTDNHPDIVQPWGGVGELRIDGLTGQTDYQGLFLQSDYSPIGSVVLRRVNIDADPTGRYLLWTSGDFELTLDRVFVTPAPGRSFERTLWPDVGAWGGVVEGSPPDGDFVPADVVGFAYDGDWSYADDQT
jgi:hypothetical protein